MTDYRETQQAAQQAAQRKKQEMQQFVQANLPQLLLAIESSIQKAAEEANTWTYYPLDDLPASLWHDVPEWAYRDELLNALATAAQEYFQRKGFETAYNDGFVEGYFCVYWGQSRFPKRTFWQLLADVFLPFWKQEPSQEPTNESRSRESQANETRTP